MSDFIQMKMIYPNERLKIGILKKDVGDIRDGNTLEFLYGKAKEEVVIKRKIGDRMFEVQDIGKKYAPYRVYSDEIEMQGWKNDN